MSDDTLYPSGSPNAKWGNAEREAWLELQTIKRSYQTEVLDKLALLRNEFLVEQYSALSTNPKRYPLMAVKTKNWQMYKPIALITGGVHGYETSGVQGAIRFLECLTEPKSKHYFDHFNIVVAPCVSPWAYETINRWNPQAVDPNRSFIANSPTEESASLMAYIKSLNSDIEVHIDLHETTDTDNTVFRPALEARDNVHHSFSEIPDGFYLVGDSENPCTDFQSHIINEVGKVTHIAPSDVQNKIIGEAIAQHGVVNYPTKELGLCTGFTDATFNTTTEVYPDSPKVDDENCILAQVTAIFSALDFVSQQ